MTNIWHHWPGIDEEVAAIFDPFGNAVHTALAFEVHGEDVLISGAGPIGLMAIGVVRHAGARHVVVSEPIAFRRAIAERMGATIAVDPTQRDLHDVQRELGMVEGFDVALEMSGNARALRSAIENMAHGGRIAQLGIPTGEITLDVNAIVFNQLTLRGIYGREMYESWYQSAVLVSAGPRHHAGDHPPLRVPRVRGGVRGCKVRRLREGHHGLAAMSDHDPSRTHWRSSKPRSTTSRRSTCTGRCGS